MIYYIYKIIFLKGDPCGRYYLGKRTFGGDDLSKDNYSGSGSFCKTYFKNYGKILFDTYLKEIIEINPSEKINSDREIEIIGNLYKTDPLCMNKTVGGRGGDSTDSKAILQYDLYGNLICTHDSESKAAQSVGLQCSATISTCCINKNNTSAGFIWRFIDEPLTKQELKNIIIHSKPIKQYTINLEFVKEWGSIKEASESLNINSAAISDICRHCNKKRHTAGGFIWCFYDEEPINNKKIPFKGKRLVKQFTKDRHEFLSEFGSLKEAAIAVDGNWQHIQKCCNNIKPSAYGYWWQFSNQ